MRLFQAGVRPSLTELLAMPARRREDWLLVAEGLQDFQAEQMERRRRESERWQRT